MAAAMAAGVLGGCSSSAQGGTASTADTSSAASTTASSADSGNVIRVGVVCSMTGGSAIYGEGAQNAVDMAVEEINSGDSGYTVEIVNGGKVADDERLQQGHGRFPGRYRGQLLLFRYTAYGDPGCQ